MKGGSPTIFLGLNLIFFCYLERNAKIQYRRQTPSGRKVSGRKKKKERKYACAERGVHLCIAHEIRVRRVKKK